MTLEQQLSASAASIRRRYGDEVFTELKLKAGATCYLCEEPMDLTIGQIVVDHVDPTGGDAVSNLYLAHTPCNALKKDLPLDAAKRMIKFRNFCESRSNNVTFDDILDAYVSDPKRQVVTIQHLELNRALIKFRNEETSVNLMTDPATGVRFFFSDVPVSFILNDTEVQPRSIDWRHAWLMAQDFENHPVHEPSSCRINLDPNNGRGQLLQFDGQHKTAAQIILGRKTVQTKIYISPSLPMIRDLIFSVQNKIRKVPLQTAIAISKLADIYRNHWEQSGARTEAEFIKSYRSDQQADAKKQLMAAIYHVIIDDDNNGMKQFVQTQRARRGTYPISMNNLTNLILRELVCQEYQQTEVGSSEDLRVPEEAKNVMVILNLLTDLLLSNDKWEFSRPKGSTPSRDHLKAERFFTPGAVKYWAPTLKRAINNRLGLDLRGPDEAAKTLLRKLSPEQVEDIRKIVKRLVEHPIWTDDRTPNIDGMLRENRPATSTRLFTREYPKRLDAAYLVGLDG